MGFEEILSYSSFHTFAQNVSELSGFSGDRVKSLAKFAIKRECTFLPSTQPTSVNNHINN
jgi:hypothetical protein